jgi:cyclopropane fatty-acyl-phospholipid synthase-like methyltransferase|tara:strand:- start:56 stop:343 length:288 start_codon:yes stop_codon:yes gene_type:complete
MNLIEDINIFNEIISNSTRFHTFYFESDNPLESIKGLNEPNYFDVVISFGVLGFCSFTTEEIIKYINNAFKVLKKGGMFYLNTDNHPAEIKKLFQ